MGNCLKRPAAATWVDDEEWEPAEYESPRSYGTRENAWDGEEKLAFRRKGGATAAAAAAAAAAATEVKIKITKKQLGELLRKVDAQGLPLQELLADLLNEGEACVQERGRTWRPVLQSIPEGSE